MPALSKAAIDSAQRPSHLHVLSTCSLSTPEQIFSGRSVNLGFQRNLLCNFCVTNMSWPIIGVDFIRNFWVTNQSTIKLSTGELSEGLRVAIVCAVFRQMH